MRNVMSNQAQRNCYQAGREARDLDKDKSPPGGLGAQRRSFWLAGYNDRDIELQVLADKRRAYGAGLVNHMVSTIAHEVFTNTAPTVAAALESIDIPYDPRLHQE
jgi:hypothetical protein